MQGIGWLLLGVRRYPRVGRREDPQVKTSEAKAFCRHVS